MQRDQTLTPTRTVLQRLLSPANPASFDIGWNDFIIWDARKQQFDIRTGFCNSAMVECMRDQSQTREVLPLIRNCFTILEPSGDPVGSASINAVIRDRFTPEFNPRRFALKDALYGQRLATLDKLLEHVLRNYWNAGINYVEFSIGVADVTRPWVWAHLIQPTWLESTNLSALSDTCYPDYNFLAAFNRNQMEVYDSAKSRWGKMDKLTAHRLLCSTDTQPCESYALGDLAERANRPFLQLP